MTSLQAKFYNWFLRRNVRNEAPLKSFEASRARMEAQVRLITPIKSRLMNFDHHLLNGQKGVWVGKASAPYVLLYLHGGGYTQGSVRTHAIMVDYLAKRASVRAFVLEYRLAPEHPFPAAIEDAQAAFDGLCETYAPENIFVAGDSAGGGLSLALMLHLKQQGKALPGGLALFSPWTDLTASGNSVTEREARDPMITGKELTHHAQHYLGKEKADHPLISPLFGDYAGAPPMLIQIGSEEVLYDDSTRLATRAQEAGVKVELQVWEGMPHVHQIALFLPEAKRALRDTAKFFTSLKR